MSNDEIIKCVVEITVAQLENSKSMDLISDTATYVADFMEAIHKKLIELNKEQ